VGVLFVKLIFVRRGPARQTFILMMQITNKIVLYLHYSYAKLYAQGTPTSAAIVSPDEGILPLAARMFGSVGAVICSDCNATGRASVIFAGLLRDLSSQIISWNSSFP
jgi:hypothetical protein